MKKLAQLWRRVTDRWWKRIIIAPIVLVAALLAIWGVAEGVYQLNVNRLSAAVDEVGRVLEPNGGTATYSYVRAPHFLDSLLCIDNGPCPTVTKGWVVLISKGQEAGVIDSILQKLGYTGGAIDARHGGGARGGITLNIEITGLGNDQSSPYAAPAGKEWRFVGVDAIGSTQ